MLVISACEHTAACTWCSPDPPLLACRARFPPIRKLPSFRSISGETSCRAAAMIIYLTGSKTPMDVTPTVRCCHRGSIRIPDRWRWSNIAVLAPQALGRTHALGNSQALETFVQEQLNLHRGQGRDILWRDSNRCPTEEEYESMVLDSEYAGSPRPTSRTRLKRDCLPFRTHCRDVFD